MEAAEQENTIKQMTNFIIQEAQERAGDIREKAKQEINIENEKIITAAREKLRTEYKNKKEQKEISKRIEKSGILNKLRIKKMAERNKLVEETVEVAKSELNKKFHNESALYKKFLMECIVQVHSLPDVLETVGVRSNPKIQEVR